MFTYDIDFYNKLQNLCADIGLEFYQADGKVPTFDISDGDTVYSGILNVRRVLKDKGTEEMRDLFENILSTVREIKD